MTFHDFSRTKIWKSMTYRHSIFFQINYRQLTNAHTRISIDSRSCSSYYCQEDKTTGVFTHIYKYFTTLTSPLSFIRFRGENCQQDDITGTEFLSAVVKIPWHYHHFPGLSMTFQAWKMVLQNSMIFQDQWALWHYVYFWVALTIGKWCHLISYKVDLEHPENLTVKGRTTSKHVTIIHSLIFTNSADKQTKKRQKNNLFRIKILKNNYIVLFIRFCNKHSNKWKSRWKPWQITHSVHLGTHYKNT